jgi:hypothetical protein
LRFLLRVANKNISMPADSPAPTLFLTPAKGVFMPRLIEVIVSPQGETTVQTKGYPGSDCLQATQFLEQALGRVTKDQKTTEFFQSDSARQHLTQ